MSKRGWKCTVSGASMPTFQKYTYLDLLVTADIKLIAIVQDMKEKVIIAQTRLNNSLLD